MNSSKLNANLASIYYAQIGFYSPKLQTNAEKLEGIINDEDIPDNYKCPLTLSIMTDPVYLLNDQTKSIFERNEITKWLNQQGTHPFSRLPFNSASLQPASLWGNTLSLKDEIAQFVDDMQQRSLRPSNSW